MEPSNAFLKLAQDLLSRGEVFGKFFKCSANVYDTVGTSDLSRSIIWLINKIVNID
jgi:hypothetical protein